jgi:hypothetical protein
MGGSYQSRSRDRGVWLFGSKSRPVFDPDGHAQGMEMGIGGRICIWTQGIFLIWSVTKAQRDQCCRGGDKSVVG